MTKAAMLLREQVSFSLVDTVLCYQLLSFEQGTVSTDVSDWVDSGVAVCQSHIIVYSYVYIHMYMNDLLAANIVGVSWLAEGS